MIGTSSKGMLTWTGIDTRNLTQDGLKDISLLKEAMTSLLKDENQHHQLLNPSSI